MNQVPELSRFADLEPLELRDSQDLLRSTLIKYHRVLLLTHSSVPLKRDIWPFARVTLYLGKEVILEITEYRF